MDAMTVELIAKYIAFAVPITAAVVSVGKLAMEWLQQSHSITEARVQQSHTITTHYLDRALDANQPLAIRHQLLRFLATPDTKGDRLSKWAGTELERIGGVVDATNRAVETAAAALLQAKNTSELAAAERRLGEAVRVQKSLLEPAATPPITAASIRAGLVTEKKLRGLDMNGEDLRGSVLAYRDLAGADFSNAKLARMRFLNCDLRAATFVGANLKGTRFYETDLRGADFSAALIDGTEFAQCRLEGANLRTAVIDVAELPSAFDDATTWPETFDPRAMGAVHINGESASTAATPALPIVGAVTTGQI